MTFPKKAINILNQITNSVSNDMRKTAAINTIIYEKARTYTFPFIIFKSYGNKSRINYTLSVSDLVRYVNRGGGMKKAMWLYGSTGHALDSGDVRIAPRELQEQLIKINDELIALEKKKDEILKTWWAKCPKLSW